MHSVNPSIDLELLVRASRIAGIDVAEIALPRHGDVLVGRMRLHYLDWGAPDAPTVVLLHGGGLNAHTWDLVCLVLRERFRCIALDLRGHGESEWSANIDYSIEALASDLEGFVDRCQFVRFALIGMSLGGLASIAFSGANSERVRGLALIDVGPEVQSSGVQRILDFAATAPEHESPDDFIREATVFNPTRDPTLLRRSVLHNVHQLPNGKWTWRYDQRPWNRPDFQTNQTRRQALWADIDRIRCPVLVVRGAQSDVFSRDEADRLATRLHDGRLVEVPLAGHSVQGDNPAGLSSVLVPFLDSLGRAEAY